MRSAEGGLRIVLHPHPRREQNRGALGAGRWCRRGRACTFYYSTTHPPVLMRMMMGLVV